MAVSITITPDDSMLWLLRPEFLAYVDLVTLDQEDYEKAEAEKSDSEYHAAVWRRLSVLNAKGMLALVQIALDLESIKREAEARINEALAHEAATLVFIADLVFVYKYWIEFNQQMLEILPVDDDYAEVVKEHMPLWMGDLHLLESRGRGAFQEQPKILSQTARSIMARVLCLREINRQYPGIAFTTLGQFGPFLKYADHPAEALTAEPAHLLKLPVEPDMGFSSPRLSRREFWERLCAIRERYKRARAELGALLDIAAQIVRGLGAGPTDAALLEHLDAAYSTISARATQAIQNSEYLKTSFYGVSMVPTAALTRACAGAEPAQPGAPSAAGLSGYYAIQESLLSVSKCKRFPGAKARGEGGPHQHRSFWRQ